MGGRGSSSGAGGVISFAMGGGNSSDSTKYLDPGKFQNEMKSKSQEQGIKTFMEKHGNEKREYYVAINKKGTVMQYNQGAKDHVGARFRDNNGRFFQADKGSVDIHNHPSGKAIPSLADLQSFATTKEIKTSYIVGKGGEKFKITKNSNFRQNGMLDAITQGQKTMYVSKYIKNIKANQKNFGYSVSGTNF